MAFLNKLFGKKQSEPTNIQVSFAIEKGGKAVAMLAVPRNAIEHPSETTRDELKKLVDGIAARCVMEGTLIRIALTIGGYDKDSREIYQVPKICVWASETFNLLPGLFGFLDEISQDVFLFCLCGPASRKETESPRFQQLLLEKRGKDCFQANAIAFPELLRKAGASEELISGFSHQLTQEMMMKYMTMRGR